MFAVLSQVPVEFASVMVVVVFGSSARYSVYCMPE